MFNRVVEFSNDSIHFGAIHNLGFLDEACTSLDTLDIGFLEPGIYYLDYNIEYYQRFGSATDSLQFEVQLFNSVNDNRERKLKIFPNPVSRTNVSRVVLPDYVILGRLVIYSLDGRIISQKEIGGNKEIFISGLYSGVYLIQVSTEYGLLNSKLVVH